MGKFYRLTNPRAGQPRRPVPVSPVSELKADGFDPVAIGRRGQDGAAGQSEPAQQFRNLPARGWPAHSLIMMKEAGHQQEFRVGRR